MKKRFVSVQFKLMFVIFSVLVVTGVVIMAKDFVDARAQLLEDNQEVAATFRKVYESTLETKTRDIAMAVETLLQDNEVTRDFHDKNREALVAKTVKLFKDSLKSNYGIKQFQFHLPPATSFLRVHKPEKFGDDLSSFRNTVVAANTTKRPVSGIEAGREGLGLRVVYPVFYEGQHIGSVEFGGDVDGILSTAAASTGMEYSVGVLSEVFKDSKRFEDKDKDVIKSNLDFFVFSNDVSKDLLKKIDLANDGAAVEFNGRSYFFKTFPMKDYSGKEVGKIVVFRDQTSVVKSMANHALIQAIVGAVSFVIIALFLYYVSMHVIVSPLSGVVKAMESLADGDLTVDVPKGKNDEIGRLIDSMNHMIDKFKVIVENVMAASSNVNTASRQLSESSVHISSSVGEQGNKAMLISTSASQMSQTAMDIAKSASAIAGSASKALEIASDGRGIVESTAKEVQSIEASVNESARVMATLGERSRQIGEIILVINDIADQTNLLALNAAIEAARAGEQGRGFAVVADEVRKLAEKTSKATTEIGGMIQSIQHETEKAVSSMQESLLRVDAGVGLSRQAGDSLVRIVDSIHELESRVHEISSATEEMAVVSENIGKDIEVISAFSSDTSDKTLQLSTESGDLERLSADLNEIVNNFRVDGKGNVPYGQPGRQPALYSPSRGELA
ncbi:MAG: methyl-accepting chemotaxis protein [Nitrospirae bacterium]|nr:methyl-accepting chemotaxis protein [Nitrospirota bacterium]